MSSSTAESSSLFATEAREFPQERARKTYESLIAAGEVVFSARGFDSTQTPDIAAKAGVSVGTFYRYFSDKMEIFLEIVRRHLVHAHEEVMAKLTPDHFVGQEKKQAIETAIAILLSSVENHPRMQRVFMEMAMRDERVAQLKQASDAEARNRLCDLLRVICTPDAVPDPEATALIIQTSVVESAIAIAGSRGPVDVSRERSLRALTELVFRALFP